MFRARPASDAGRIDAADHLRRQVRPARSPAQGESSSTSGEIPPRGDHAVDPRLVLRQSRPVDEILWRNRSYIFFREAPVDDPDLGPVAAAKVPLTPGRSVAVDRLLHTFGTPFFIDAPSLTAFDGRPFRRLMIAQDTGSAIVGPGTRRPVRRFGRCRRRGRRRDQASGRLLRAAAEAAGRSGHDRVPRTLSDEDRILWNLVARTAKPLKGRKAMTSPEPRRSPRRTPRSRRRASGTARRRRAGTGRNTTLQAALDRPTHDKLSEGRLPIEGRVDLHGMTPAAGPGLLLSFLGRAHAGGCATCW